MTLFSIMFIYDDMCNILKYFGGVFSTREKAEEYGDDVCTQGHYDSYNIYQIEIDERIY